VPGLAAIVSAAQNGAADRRRHLLRARRERPRMMNSRRPSRAAATAEPQQVDLDVPSTTVAATVQINVKPSKGAVLLYTGPSYDKPIRFPGPARTRVVPTSSRTVRIELVEGAKSFRVKILGRIDGLDGSKIEPPSR
jgi:hypothetical protein